MTPLLDSIQERQRSITTFQLLEDGNAKFEDPNGPRDSEEDSMKRIVDYVWSYSKALMQKMGVQVEEDPSYEPVLWSGRHLPAERRRETRHQSISLCTYGLMSSVDCDGGILEEGQGAAVNESPTGLRLLLGVAPSKGQLLEIQTGHSALGRAICLAVVCWTKLLREDAQGALYLVGCRVNFDATHGISI